MRLLWKEEGGRLVEHRPNISEFGQRLCGVNHEGRRPDEIHITLEEFTEGPWPPKVDSLQVRDMKRVAYVNGTLMPALAEGGRVVIICDDFEKAKVPMPAAAREQLNQ